jgi:uncharacterized repeat protein (TIGR02543 family)
MAERGRHGFSGMAPAAMCLLVLCAGMPGAYAQWTDLVQNGTFEADPIPAYPGYTGAVTGWILGGGDLLNDATGPFYTADLGPIPQGTRLYGHQGAGSTSQVINGLNNGQYCHFAFYLNCRSATTPMTIEARLGTHTLYGPTRITPTNPFRFLETTFNYDSAWGNTLTFYFTNPEGDATLLLDHVQIITPLSYTVGYSVNPAGGGSVSGPGGITYSGTPGSSITVNVTPNAGYSVGTVTASNGTITPAGGNNYTLSGVTANTTVTGNFTPNTYTVTFDAQGGSAPSPASKSVTFASTYGALATTSRTGYTFTGWYTTAGGGTLVTSGTTVTTTSNHSLYAHWTPNNYTVTFDAQGGTAPSPGTKSVTFASTYGALATTSRTGYTFNGWFTASTGGTLVTTGTAVTTASDHTLYAQWTANAYTVTFDAQGGTAPSPGTKSVTFASTYGALATTGRTGYTFNGWFTASTGGTLVTTGTAVTTASDHTLYAQWTANTYTVTFDAQGGAAPAPGSKSVTYDAAYGALATTGRTGYTFNGWFTAASGGTLVTAGTVVATASDHTLYAQWTVNTYTVTFDGQGGTAPVPDSKPVTYGTSYGALATTGRTGYTFNGWFTAASGGTLVTAGSTVTTASDHTLYAQWTANAYTVTFNAQGGSAPSPGTKSVTFDAAYGALATTVRTGYTLTGWYTAASGGTLVTAGTVLSTAADHTLYAQWTANTYTLTFDAQGGAAPSPGTKSVTYGSAYGTLATTSRTGYTFSGWYTAAIGGTQVTSVTSVTTASDHALYAQWTALTYTVGYAASPVSGGSASGPSSITHDGTPGDTITVSITPNPGWQVDGVTASNGAISPAGGNDYTLSGVTANTTVTASFSILNYTVDYAANPAAGGSVSGPASITHSGTPDGSITVNVTVNAGWLLDTVSASNGAITPAGGNDYTLSGVTGNTTVTATFIEEVVEGEGQSEGEGQAEGEGEPPAGLQVGASGETYFSRPLGESVTFAVTVSGAQGALSYQWVRITPDKAFEIIPGANAASFTIPEVAEEDAGEYQCDVSDDALAETASSPVFTLVVTAEPELPAAGLFGLALAGALSGLAGMVLTRKRRG